MNQKELTRYLVQNMLIQIEYFAYLGGETVIVLNTEKDNVYHYDKFYTVPKETIDKIKKVIEESDIFSIRFDGKEKEKLFRVSNMMLLDAGSHNIELKLDGKHCSYELEATNHMKKYFNQVDSYRRAYAILSLTVEELMKAGIEFDNLAYFLK